MKMIHHYEDSEESLIYHSRSLADSIREVTTNLKGKQLSARAIRRAEARKLKPKYK